MADVRKHMIFHGRVQGVGFRYTAKYLAKINESAGMGWKMKYELERIRSSEVNMTYYRTLDP